MFSGWVVASGNSPRNDAHAHRIRSGDHSLVGGLQLWPKAVIAFVLYLADTLVSVIST